METQMRLKLLQRGFGLMLLLFGLNGFFAFIQVPEKQGFAALFLDTLHDAKYILPTVALIMTTAGTLLLLNRGAAFGLMIQLPVSFNIFAFHLLHDEQGLTAASIMFIANLLLIIRHPDRFKPLFN